MANVIKHKRGSGSDPVANDLVVGEVAIRTDVGKLFTKMDNGSVAEIAGGGSDIAINTLSSSSGTGGGSATFNGSAFRFTLSSPPSVSAQQLLVSINGVIQKPVAGTGQPSEGFSVDGTDIILGDAPETGADFFILTFKSLGVSEPADNSVTSAKIVDGAIVNADINASAAIAGTKVSPNFGSQTITTTGRVLIGTTVDNSFKFKISDGGGFEFAMLPNDSGVNNFTNYDRANNAYVPLSTNASEHRFGISGTEKMRIDSSGRVGIGTTTAAVGGAPSSQTGQFNVISSAGSGQWAMQARADNTAGNGLFLRAGNDSSYYTAYLTGYDENNIHMVVRGDGNVGIGTSSPSTKFVVSNSGAEGFEFSHSSGTNELNSFNRNTSGRSPIDIIGQTFKVITGNPSLTTGLFQDSSGKVGIGTTGPTTRLSVVDDSGITIEATSTGTAGQLTIIGVNNNNNVSAITRIKSVSTDSSSAETATTFSNRNSSNVVNEHMRITSSGHVGIRTTSTPSVLSIKDTITGVQPIDDTQTITIQTGATSGAENTGTGIMFLNHNGSSGSGGGTFGGTISCVKENSTVGNTANCMRFATRPNGGGVTERMRINSGGAILIGRTSVGNTGNGHSIRGGDSAVFSRDAVGETVQISRNSNDGSLVEFRSGNSGNASVLATIAKSGSSVVYNTSSDYRLKENAVAISDGITRLKTLKPYRFNFKADASKIVDGFFAHEVTSSVPEAITGTKDQVDSDNNPVYQQIDQSKLVPLLVAALQEAIGRIEALEAK